MKNISKVINQIIEEKLNLEGERVYYLNYPYMVLSYDKTFRSIKLTHSVRDVDTMRCRMIKLEQREIEKIDVRRRFEICRNRMKLHVTKFSHRNFV